MMRRARAGVAGIAAAAALAGGCSRDDGLDLSQVRWDRDAEPVVFVDRRAGALEFVDADGAGEDPQSAQEVEIPVGIRGALDGETDADHFRLELEEPTHLSALVTGAEDIDLILDVLDESGERIVRSDRAPVGYSEGVPNLSLDAGVYYVAILEFVGGRERGGEGAREGESEPYELVLRPYEHDTGFEEEPTGSPEEATDVELERDMFGYIGWHEDTDYWRVPLEDTLATDGFRVAISGVPWVAPEVTILTQDEEVVLAREGARGQPVYVHNLAADHAFDLGADQHFYIRITSARSNPEEPYRLRVARADLAPEVELEPNHERSLATALRSDASVREGERRGHLDRGDIDFYRLSSSPGARTLHAEVEPASSLEPRLEVTVGGDEAAADEGSGAGASARVDGVEISAGEEAYVVVGGDARDPDGGDYRLRWMLQ